MTALYVSDLDGTLLSPQATLSTISRAGLRHVLLDGMPFTVATARSVVFVRRVLGDLPLRLPIIELNGAFLTHLATGRHLRVHAIPTDLATELYHRLDEAGHIPFVSTFNGLEDCSYYREIVNAGMQWHLDDRQAEEDGKWHCQSDVRACLQEEVVCLTVIARQEALVDLAAYIAETYGSLVQMHVFENPYQAGWYWLTLHDRRATKAEAIRLLREWYGYGEQELVVFGDQNNDIPMFLEADRAYAVANATERLKRHATAVIGSNAEDSVVHFLRAEWADVRLRRVQEGDMLR